MDTGIIALILDTVLYFEFCCLSALLELPISIVSNEVLVGLGGFRVTSSPQDPRFMGSNLTEVDGFFQGIKILSTSPQEGL